MVASLASRGGHLFPLLLLRGGFDAPAMDNRIGGAPFLSKMNQLLNALSSRPLDQAPAFSAVYTTSVARFSGESAGHQDTPGPEVVCDRDAPCCWLIIGFVFSCAPQLFHPLSRIVVHGSGARAFSRFVPGGIRISKYPRGSRLAFELMTSSNRSPPPLEPRGRAQLAQLACFWCITTHRKTDEVGIGIVL